MAKIIKIDGEVISIGTDDGKIKEVRAQDVNFDPAVGNEVEVFVSDGTVIVTKKENKIEENTNSLYLVFCWTFIPGFIAFIELIIALCRKSDANGNILV